MMEILSLLRTGMRSPLRCSPEKIGKEIPEVHAAAELYTALAREYLK